MKRTTILTSILALSTVAFGQEPASTGGWRRAADQAPATDAPAPNWSAQPADAFGQRGGEARPAPQLVSIPPTLTLQPGTFITIRIDQALTSDHNVAGDGFSGTLLKPLVADGVVVAQRGQTVSGRVVEAVKAGRISGTSRLALELTDLSLVDGQQARVKSQLMSWRSSTSNGRDAGAVATTTALGAAVGAAADGGVGAGIGAGAGAAAGLIGVLLTRGHQTVIDPESELTFRVEAPLTVSTERAPHAFRLVDPREYDRGVDAPRLQTRVVRPAPYYYGSPYPYFYSPYYWGPSFGFYYGRSYGWGRGWYGGGRSFYRGGGRRW